MCSRINQDESKTLTVQMPSQRPVEVAREKRWTINGSAFDQPQPSRYASIHGSKTERQKRARGVNVEQWCLNDDPHTFETFIGLVVNR